MKKMITMAAVALLAFSGNSLFAQSGEEKIGFKAGLNLANIHGDDAEDNKMKMGFHIGGFATIPFGNLSFQPELLISTRGYKVDTEDDDSEASLNLMYVDIPLLLKFYATDNFNIHVGPQIGFNLSSKYKMDPEPDGFDGDASDETNSIDYGAALGLEYDTDMGLVVGARYYYGFANIGKDYEETIEVMGQTTKVEVDALDQKNNMIQIYVGIGF